MNHFHMKLPNGLFCFHFRQKFRGRGVNLIIHRGVSKSPCKIINFMMKMKHIYPD